MKISSIIERSSNDLGILDVLQDIEFQTLGLSSSDIDLSFCTFIDNEKYLDTISKNACMIITKPEIARQIRGKGVCVSNSPRISFFQLHNYLTKTDDYKYKKDFKKEVGSNCNISNLAYISENNVKIGDNVTIEEFVSIKENTIIGDNTIIRAGAVIGGEGFEFKRLPSGDVLPVIHAGWTYIGNDVEIQQNSCVDKAIYPWDSTIIYDNCKLDNFIHIAHGVKLGKGVFLAAGALTGGRTVIQENTWIGVGATVSNALTIGKNSSINIGAVVTRNLEDEASVTGNFAIDHDKFIQFIKSIR